MIGKIVKDWSKVDFRNPDHARLVLGAFQYFMEQPDKDPKFKAAMQAFTTKGDFPAEILQVLEKFHATLDWDTGYESIFDIRDFTGTQASGFELLNVENGLTFTEIPIGEKINVQKFSGTKTTVTFARYGGALGWDRTMMDDRQYWSMEDTAIAFRNKAMQKRSQVFYDLIDAVPNNAQHNVAWAAVDGSVPNTDADYIALRDTNTINGACEEILLALKDEGLGVTATSPFILLAPIQLKARVLRALAQVQQPFAGSVGRVIYNVQPIFTMMLSASDVYYICVPKKKAKGGYRQNLTIFGEFDILAYADVAAGWMRYGGAIGETDQFRRCSTS